jgi:hypothetical protein
MGAAWALAVRRGTFRPSRPPAPGSLLSAPWQVGVEKSPGPVVDSQITLLRRPCKSPAHQPILIYSRMIPLSPQASTTLLHAKYRTCSDWRAFPRHHQWTKSFAEGTSAPTPFLACLIALINDIRLRAGRSVVGVLNPLLYSEQGKSSLRDVTEFSTEDYEEGETFVSGYDASIGWDPASGLGATNL